MIPVVPPSIEFPVVPMVPSSLSTDTFAKWATSQTF